MHKLPTIAKYKYHSF